MNTNLKHVLAISGLAVTTLIACKQEPQKDTAMTEKTTPSIVLDNMDTTVSPNDDFYNFVNGNWAKKQYNS
jgi:putative endopeptidase